MPRSNQYDRAREFLHGGKPDHAEPLESCEYCNPQWENLLGDLIRDIRREAFLDALDVIEDDWAYDQVFLLMASEEGKTDDE